MWSFVWFLRPQPEALKPVTAILAVSCSRSDETMQFLANYILYLAAVEQYQAIFMVGWYVTGGCIASREIVGKAAFQAKAASKPANRKLGPPPTAFYTIPCKE